MSKSDHYRRRRKQEPPVRALRLKRGRRRSWDGQAAVPALKWLMDLGFEVTRVEGTATINHSNHDKDQYTVRFQIKGRRRLLDVEADNWILCDEKGELSTMDHEIFSSLYKVVDAPAEVAV